MFSLGLLTVMATVLVDPELTYGKLYADSRNQKIWQEYRDKDYGEPRERWHRMFDIAMGYLAHPEIATQKVLTYGEIQMILTKDADVRHKMHLAYKILRADTEQQLHRDFTQSYAKIPQAISEKDSPTLWEAAFDGRFSRVKHILESCRPNRESVLIDNIADMGGIRGVTPLNAAAQNGHIDIVKILLDYKADPCYRALDESTPLLKAVYLG